MLPTVTHVLGATQRSTIGLNMRKKHRIAIFGSVDFTKPSKHRSHLHRYYSIYYTINHHFTEATFPNENLLKISVASYGFFERIRPFGESFSDSQPHQQFAPEVGCLPFFEMWLAKGAFSNPLLTTPYTFHVWNIYTYVDLVDFFLNGAFLGKYTIHGC